MMLRIVTALNAARRIEGWLRVGWIDRLRARRILSGLTTPVAPSAMVDRSARLAGFPETAHRDAGCAAGWALALGCQSRPSSCSASGRAHTTCARARRGAACSQAEPAGDDSGADCRGLLLLNLAPGADAPTSNTAPPLGNRDEVIERSCSDRRHSDSTRRGRGVAPRVHELAATSTSARRRSVASATDRVPRRTAARPRSRACWPTPAGAPSCRKPASS